MDWIITAAKELATGGIVLVLVFLLIALGTVTVWGAKTLFLAYVDLSNRLMVSTEAQTKVLEAQTRALEANARASEANAEASKANQRAIEGLRDLIIALDRRQGV